MAAKKILMVEDERDFATLMTFDIEKHGYEVLVAHDGLAGLEKARSEKPDLILFDIKMPGMDGYNFVRQIKKDAELAEIPLIGLSSYNAMQEMVEMEGVTHFFTKTAKMDELFETIDKILA